MALLDDIKKVLRISTTAMDTEVQDLIDAAKMDLQISGIAATKIADDTDPLIMRAVSVYCKANFGYDNPDTEKYQRSYDMLKMHLALCSDYNAEAVV